MKHTKGAAIAVTIVALAGCAGTPGGATTPPGKTTLSIALWNYASTPEFKALIDAFQAAHPDITIKPVDILNSNYPDKVTTMLAGGDTTDVITVKSTTQYAGFAAKQQLLPLNDLQQKLADKKLSGLEDYSWKGTYYSIPYRTDFYLLYYNKKLFKDAGLPAPERLTWDQFAEHAIKLTHGSGTSKVYGAYIHTWNAMVQGLAAAQTGRSQLDPSDYGWMKSQYELTLRLQKAGAIRDYGEALNQQVSYQTEFATGKAAMVPMGTWLIAPLLADRKAGKTDVDWGIAPLPQTQASGPITTAGGPTGFGINKRAKNVAAARKFIEFAAGEKGAQAVASIGIVPAYRSEAILRQYFGLPGMPQDDLSKRAFAPDVVRPESPISDSTAPVNTVLNQEHGLIMTGSKPVDAAIQEMQQRVSSEVLHQ
ncbi:ABC transporter substrate-binding protein [[Actinomadura] parvosata]|uniref:ABC transporter substrate-binding protein n=1 Tax=[Actinomadura] parvosata TaxID=1955412 RepID=UPI00406CCEF9